MLDNNSAVTTTTTLPTIKLNELNEMLDTRLRSFIEAHTAYQGEGLLIQGRLKDLERSVERSRYAKIYDLIIQDDTGKIEVEISKKLLTNLSSGQYVEAYGYPKFNFYNSQCTKRFAAFAISVVNAPDETEVFQQITDRTALLKKYKPKNKLFPYADKITVAMIYSSASAAKVDNDFYRQLDNTARLVFTKFPTSLSNINNLCEALNKAQDFDVTVLIRGGGDTSAFEIFDNPQVLEAFNQLNGYKIVGLGHDTDISIIDYLADYSGVSPTEAGVHLRENIKYYDGLHEQVDSCSAEIMGLKQKVAERAKRITELEVNLKNSPDNKDVLASNTTVKKQAELIEKTKKQFQIALGVIALLLLYIIMK